MVYIVQFIAPRKNVNQKSANNVNRGLSLPGWLSRDCGPTLYHLVDASVDIRTINVRNVNVGQEIKSQHSHFSSSSQVPVPGLVAPNVWKIRTFYIFKTFLGIPHDIMTNITVLITVSIYLSRVVSEGFSGKYIILQQDYLQLE